MVTAVLLAILISGTWLIRLAARSLLGNLWRLWHIRRTVDAFLLFTLALLLIAAAGSAMDSFSLRFCPSVFGTQGLWTLNRSPDALQPAIEHLSYLQGCEWFCQNIFSSIVLPTFVVAFLTWYTKGRVKQ